MKKFSNNSSYKVIRITDDESIKLTFETYYPHEKRNFDIINLPDDSQVIDILLEHPDVSAIVVQVKDNSNQTFNNLINLPDYYKRRVHIYDTNQNYGIDLALKITNAELSHWCDPKFSFVTPLYKTKLEYFKRTYDSLRAQTLNDWEWVLVDDSPEPMKDVKEFIDNQKDVRLKYFRISPTNGNIGLSKWRANCMSTGQWLIELDHDDLLLNWCLECISDAIKKYPDNKFIYSDNTTIDKDDNVTKCMYGNNFEWGLGYGYSYMSKTPDPTKTIRTDSSGPVNNACIRHIVGVPNHFRCWERNFYFSIGGHNQHERIADDYELLVRSFLNTRFTHIKACCYAQRFDGNNSQFHETPDTDGQGNISDIQRRVRLAAIYYDKRIHQRLIELGLNDDKWIEGDPMQTAHVYQKLNLPDICEDQFYPFGKDDAKPIKLGVFYLATSVYKEYFDEFKNSLKNMFPDDETIDKHLIIMADGLSEYDGNEIHGFKVKHYDVIDYPYPCVCMNKFQMVAKYMKDMNIDYGMFFDADSIILEKSKEFWGSFKQKMMSGKLLCSGHPHYLFTPDIVLNEPFVVTREDSVAYMDSKTMNEHKSYIITSFFAGSREVITKYANKIYKMIGEDLSKIRWVPKFVDEAYMNTIYVKDVILGEDDDVLKEKYITINPYPFGDHPRKAVGNYYTNNFPEIDTIFINQKYNTSIKDKKKENQI